MPEYRFTRLGPNDTVSRRTLEMLSLMVRGKESKGPKQRGERDSNLNEGEGTLNCTTRVRGHIQVDR